MYPPPPIDPPPPPRSRSRVWAWVLGGCGGCLVLTIAGCLVAGFGIRNWVQGITDVGPVNMETVQQRMGPDVPVYPGSTVDEPKTRALLATLKVVESMAKGRGAEESAIIAFDSKDAPEKIAPYLRKELVKRGWEKSSGDGGAKPNAAGEYTLEYRKEETLLQIEVSPEASGGSEIRVSKLRGMMLQSGRPGSS